MTFNRIVSINITAMRSNRFKIIPYRVATARYFKADTTAALQNESDAVGVTKVGATVNMALAITKGFTGVSVGSTALIADAVNNLGDLFTDAIVYASIVQARKKPSALRPWVSTISLCASISDYHN